MTEQQRLTIRVELARRLKVFFAAIKLLLQALDDCANAERRQLSGAKATPSAERL